MKVEGAATVFRVGDLAAALTYYTEILGFAEDFRFGDYAGIKLQNVCLHLCSHHANERPIGGGNVYVFCDDVDGYHGEIKGRGALVKSEPRDYPYGMRDFIVMDPDGNQLSFGCESKLPEAA